MTNCNGCATPMESRIQLSKRSEALAVDKTEYRSIIGSLRYLLHTRPDLSFSVGFLSQFMESPKHDHKVALKRVLRYLSAATGYGLQYSRGRESEIDWVFKQ
jgi:predicted PP-loop superfamily ATPase